MISRIKTAKEIEKANKRKQVIVGVVMIGLLVLSSLGYSLLSSSDSNGDASTGTKVVENGIEFSFDGYYWNANIYGTLVKMRYLPSEVSDVVVEGEYSLGNYNSAVLYVEEINEGSSEIILNLESYLLRYQEACLSSENCAEDLPVKTCADNFILFDESTSPKVYAEDSCVFIEGDQVKGADAFLYRLFGISATPSP